MCLGALYIFLGEVSVQVNVFYSQDPTFFSSTSTLYHCETELSMFAIYAQKFIIYVSLHSAPVLRNAFTSFALCINVTHPSRFRWHVTIVTQRHCLPATFNLFLHHVTSHFSSWVRTSLRATVTQFNLLDLLCLVSCRDQWCFSF